MKKFHELRKKAWDAIGVFLRPTIRRRWPQLFVTCEEYITLAASYKKAISERDALRNVQEALLARTLAAEATERARNQQFAASMMDMETAITLRGRVMAEELTAQQAIKIKDLIAANERLQQESHTDPLTGMCNRRGLDDRFRVAYSTLMHSEQEQPPTISAMAIDVDGFKYVNDTYGHGAGDRVLAKIAKLIVQYVGGRPSDITARLGGDEFIVVFPQADVRVAYAKALALRDAVEKAEFQYGLKVTLSIGVSEISILSHNQTVEDTLKWLQTMADRALYQSKSNGRNRVICYVEAVDLGRKAVAAN